MTRMFTRVAVLTVAIATAAGALWAQDARQPESKAEEQARMARKGAGLLGGTWSLSGLPTPSGATESNSPFLEAFFRKGLDEHIALETMVGFWQRAVTVPGSGGLGGSAGGKSTIYLIPQFAGIRFYPFTTADDALEPYIGAGIGFTIGIADQPSQGGLFGGSGGTAMLAGIGLAGGAGAEWRFSKAFGLTGGVDYRHIQFFDELAGAKVYKGLGVKAGLTYRFQYQK